MINKLTFALFTNSELTDFQLLLDTIWNHILDCFDDATKKTIPFDLKKSGHCIVNSE